MADHIRLIIRYFNWDHYKSKSRGFFFQFHENLIISQYVLRYSIMSIIVYLRQTDLVLKIQELKRHLYMPFTVVLKYEKFDLYNILNRAIKHLHLLHSDTSNSPFKKHFSYEYAQLFIT